MSSVQSKDHSLRKVPLYRKMSFDKIRCSASPLLGSIFSRDSSIIHLLVNAMNSSRAVVQKPVTVVIIPAIQFLCVAMAFLVYLIRKLNRGVSCEKLDKFISEINQLQSNQQTYSVQKTIKARISKTLEQQISSSNQESQVETRGELLLDKTPSESSKTKQILDDNKRLMQVATFAAVAFVYVQFCFLLYFTSLTQFRIGFVFLLACAFYISYIYLKISLTTNLREPARRVSRREIMTNKDMKALNSSRPATSVFFKTRSRSQVTTENCAEKEKLL